MTDHGLVLAHADRLVERVRAIIAADPARRAALRRTAGLLPEDPRVISAHGVVASYVSDTFHPNDYPAIERAFYAVAAMMAAQPRSARDADAADTETPEPEPGPSTEEGDAPTEAEAAHGPAGETAGTAEPSEPTAPKHRRPNFGAALAKAVLNGALKEESTEQRLHLLARQPLDGVHRHLPRMVLHARADDVPVDWGLLARDLARWGHSPRKVAKEWVQTYHRTLESARRKKKSDTRESETV